MMQNIFLKTFKG